MASDMIDRTYLLLHPAIDHAAWVGAGLGDFPTHAEYEARVLEVAAAMECATVIVRATVAEQLDTMRRHGLPNTPEGRSQLPVLILLDRESER